MRLFGSVSFIKNEEISWQPSAQLIKIPFPYLEPGARAMPKTLILLKNCLNKF
jgi:hypothetical protein